VIPDAVIREIQERTNIVDVISEFAPLRKMGRNFKGLCLFHEEKTPSFVVSPEKQIFHCFGCGASGNVFTFLMKQKKMDFPDAVRELGAKAGVPVPEDDRDGGVRSSVLKELAGAVQCAADFYARKLEEAPEGSPVRRYVASRGLGREALGAFGIGYSPEAWDELYRYASKRLSAETLEKAGLIMRKSSGGYYDRFRNRLMFPLVDVKGSAIGFGARALDDGFPKYLNSPETPIYQKGKHLYGMNRAVEALKDDDRLVLVEGYMDVVTCVQGGVRNVAASSGTALTPDQVRLIKRFTRNVTVLFDGDKAGEMASLRGLEILVQEDCDVRIAELPEGHDPDSYMRAAGGERFRRNVLDRAKSLFDYKFDALRKRYDPALLEEKVKIAMEMLETIRKAPNAVFRSSLVKRLSDELRVPETALLAEMEKKGAGVRTLVRAGEASPEARGREAYVPMIERILIGLFLAFPECTERAKRAVTLEDFKNGRARSVAELIFAAGEEPLGPSQILNRVRDDAEASTLVAQSIHEVENIGDHEKAFRDCLRHLEDSRRKRRREALRREIEHAETRGDHARVRELLHEFSLMGTEKEAS
jgi:DNA primase